MILFLICFILCVVIGWHVMFAFLGGVLILGAVGIFITIGSIVMFCVAVLVSLSIPGAIGLVVGGVFAIWTLIAIILTPVLFPILLPLLIIYAVISAKQRREAGRPIKIIYPND